MDDGGLLRPAIPSAPVGPAGPDGPGAPDGPMAPVCPDGPGIRRNSGAPCALQLEARSVDLHAGGVSRRTPVSLFAHALMVVAAWGCAAAEIGVAKDGPCDQSFRVSARRQNRPAMTACLETCLSATRTTLRLRVVSPFAEQGRRWANQAETGVRLGSVECDLFLDGICLGLRVIVVLRAGCRLAAA